MIHPIKAKGTRIMAKVKPLVMNFDNINDLTKMKEEYEFIGREVEVNNAELKLTILTLPKKYKRKITKPTRIARDTDKTYDEYEQ